MSEALACNIQVEILERKGGRTETHEKGLFSVLVVKVYTFPINATKRTERPKKTFWERFNTIAGPSPEKPRKRPPAGGSVIF